MNFKEELNEKQYEAVIDNSQYLRIIAGAGSGKTRVLTYRIAYLIKELNVNPFKILAITFTNKVAKEMKNRALSLIQGDTPINLNIFTFHGFCSRFLRAEINRLDISKNFLIIDDDDQEKLFKNCAQELNLKRTDALIEASKKFIAFQKTNGRLPSDCKIDTTKPEQVKCLEFFKLYEKKKASMIALDFDDLLIYTIKILSTFSDVREKYIHRFSHILIDEFQDTNNVQFRLLRLLSGENTSIYVVGDPDQTIYTWRGAEQRIILDIDKYYSPMKTIILNRNYRSNKFILEHANNLIAFNKERIKKDLYTEKTGGEDIVIRSFFDNQAEGNFVVEKIHSLMNLHPELKYSDFCVLYRSSYLSLSVEKCLARNNIPYRVYGGLKFYSRKEIKDALAYFRIIVNTKDDVSFERIINVPRRKIGDKSIDILKNEAKSHELSMIQYVEKIDEFESELKPSVINSILELLNKCNNVRNDISTNYKDCSSILLEFLKDIGYIDYLSSLEEEDDNDRVANVMALLDDVASYFKEFPEGKFIDYLNNISLLSGQDDINGGDTVSLMTVHTAKGLEFDTVFVISLAQFVFPNNRAIEERSNGLEEERRLCYVAFTRAQNRLFVSYNRSYNYTSGTSNIPSQFVEESKLKPYEKPVSQFFNNSKLYSYSNNADKKRDVIDVNKNVVNLAATPNNIVWNVGDKLKHDVFGTGVVLDVLNNGQIIVNFDDFGEKKLIGNHFKLHKIN